jgi:hypothetical protein
MYDHGREPVNSPRMPWHRAIHLPGAAQMQHVRDLMVSRPFLNRIPDQGLVLQSQPFEGDMQILGTRDLDGSYVFVYFPNQQKAVIDLSRLSGNRIRVSWYDVRTGDLIFEVEIDREQSREFAPPSSGPDWVLVLDSR